MVVDGFLIQNNSQRIMAIQAVSSRKERFIKRGIITAEMTELNKVLVIEQQKKKDYDIKMAAHTSLETRAISDQVDHYRTQINKYTAGFELCQKALISSKKEIVEEYKKNNIFDATPLKSVQNKLLKLSSKLSRT